MTEHESTLSHWGWGRADKFPERQTREGMGQMVAATLGILPESVRDPVPLADITLPTGKVSPPKALEPIVDTSAHARASHTYGRAFVDIVRGFEGDFSCAPDLVARPTCAEEVVQLLDWCAEANLAAIPFGGGTSVVGGVEARFEREFGGVVSIDMRQMDKVLEVDHTSLLARVQAGAPGPILERQLAEHNLTLRHFPQSFELSTLGGWIATRAGGHFATVYTHIDDFVAGLSAVTPAGAINTRTLPASGAGPDPNRLLIGSEGALGIITEATMRVRPKPGYRAQVSVRFDDFERAVEATRLVAQSGLSPANCRLLDKREAAMHQVVFDGSHVLILAFESAHFPVGHLLDQALSICLGFGGRHDAPKVSEPGEDKASEEGSASNWRSAFINAPYLINTLVSLGLVVDTFETACTWTNFGAMHADIIASVRAVMKEVCGGGRVACRFTHVYPDGPAPYYTFVAPGKVGQQVDQWWAIKRAASEALARHGGTITHHHAVGRTHGPWYRKEVPELFIDSLRAVKSRLDPAGILNPGVLLEG